MGVWIAEPAANQGARLCMIQAQRGIVHCSEINQLWLMKIKKAEQSCVTSHLISPLSVHSQGSVTKWAHRINFMTRFDSYCDISQHSLRTIFTDFSNEVQERFWADSGSSLPASPVSKVWDVNHFLTEPEQQEISSQNGKIKQESFI